MGLLKSFSRVETAWPTSDSVTEIHPLRRNEIGIQFFRLSRGGRCRIDVGLRFWNWGSHNVRFQFWIWLGWGLGARLGIGASTGGFPRSFVRDWEDRSIALSSAWAAIKCKNRSSCSDRFDIRLIEFSSRCLASLSSAAIPRRLQGKARTRKGRWDAHRAKLVGAEPLCHVLT